MAQKQACGFFGQKGGRSEQNFKQAFKREGAKRGLRQAVGFFDETEKDVFRRARNCHNNTPAKNATLEQYKKATGLEAVLGFLYVSGDAGRILELLNAAYEKGEEFI